MLRSVARSVDAKRASGRRARLRVRVMCRCGFSRGPAGAPQGETGIHQTRIVFSHIASRSLHGLVIVDRVIVSRAVGGRAAVYRIAVARLPTFRAVYVSAAESRERFLFEQTVCPQVRHRFRPAIQGRGRCLRPGAADLPACPRWCVLGPGALEVCGPSGLGQDGERCHAQEAQLPLHPGIGSAFGRRRADASASSMHRRDKSAFGSPPLVLRGSLSDSLSVLAQALIDGLWVMGWPPAMIEGAR